MAASLTGWRVGTMLAMLRSGGAGTLPTVGFARLLKGVNVKQL